MSKSLNSPTAQLLKTSRLFSLPRPLHPAAIDQISATGTYRASESATLPYPTHQAITTPASSQFRGDFGLKRSLPAKAIRGRPQIRVRAQDNSAHITDFEGAQNHTQTAAKWQQMGVPFLIRETRSVYSGTGKTNQSVYDANVDNTDPEAVRLGLQQDQGFASRPGREIGYSMKRWKYEGPYITGMQEGEFSSWLESWSIQGRKEEFKAFLIQRLLDRRVRDSERALREKGQPRATSAALREEMRSDIELNYDIEMKRLRDEHEEHFLGSELTAAICDFLDLPGIRDGAQSESESFARTRALQEQVTSSLASNQSGPPSTHPGAGLGHVRTNAIMENHPLWGPQAHGSPILARVVRPRNTGSGNEYQAKLGVGGVITSDPIGDGFRNDKRQSFNERKYETQEEIEEHYLDTDRMVYQLDENLPGGNKIWVQPQAASVDEQGCVRLEISRGDKEAVAVRRNKVEPIHEARSAALRPSAPYAGRYASQPRSRTTGFDAELGEGARRSAADDSATAARIRELLNSAPRR